MNSWLTLAGSLTGSVTLLVIALVVQRRTRGEVNAGVRKTLADADTGAVTAAKVMIDAMGEAYTEGLAELRSMRAELTEMRAELTSTRSELGRTQLQLAVVTSELAEVTHDRDRLVQKLDKSMAENLGLRARLEHLEANAPPERTDIARRRAHRQGDTQP